MRIAVLIITVLSLLHSTNSSAQTGNSCGYSYLVSSLPKRDSVKAETEPRSSANKLSANEVFTIPVFFHIVLTQQQLNQLGGEKSLPNLLQKQINTINEGFNAEGGDTSKIPLPFKPLLGRANIRFALARKSPTGAPTAGYEIIKTTKTGFELNSKYGSGIGFSDSKYSAAGGVDAWDQTAYINIWVINPVEDGKPSQFLGLTISPTLLDRFDIPFIETGITLNYKVWVSAGMHKVLTHELGHYFKLAHIWGDDDSLCVGNGGKDDGISDTPPQAAPTAGCPVFPKLDKCSNVAPGIMFMNFMDYSDDRCQFMFTQEQAANMRSLLAPNERLHSLTQHPKIIDSISELSAEVFSIYPNPANQKIYIVFEKTSEDLNGIAVFNSIGQQVALTKILPQQATYEFDVSGWSSGLYIVLLDQRNKKKIIRKFAVQH